MSSCNHASKSSADALRKTGIELRAAPKVQCPLGALRPRALCLQEQKCSVLPWLQRISSPQYANLQLITPPQPWFWVYCLCREGAYRSLHVQTLHLVGRWTGIQKPGGCKVPRGTLTWQSPVLKHHLWGHGTPRKRVAPNSSWSFAAENNILARFRFPSNSTKSFQKLLSFSVLVVCFF